jgi:uncharacterized protein (TIGR02271 family)
MNQVDPQSSKSGNILVVSGDLDLQEPYTELWMPDGKVIRLLTTQLAPVALDSSATESEESPEAIVIPIVEEHLDIEKRTVTTGAVTLRKVVQEYQEALNEPLAVRTFDIERVVLNQPVEFAPPVRQEGSVTIYSLVEEQMVLTKQLILKEEIRVTQRDTERLDTQVVTLKREHLVVERPPVGPSDHSE